MRWPLVAGSLLGFFGVALGAVGAHVLKARLPAEDYERFSTALSYHQLHAITLTAIGLYALQASSSMHRRLHLTSGLFITGIICFCGTLYMHALTGMQIPLAPFGGISLMLGWLSLILLACFRKQ